MSTEHTPTPYSVTERDANGNYEIREADENATVAKVVSYGVGPFHAMANAAFIVRACNSHDALVAALRGLLLDYAQLATVAASRPADIEAVLADHGDHGCARARAALAAAEVQA